MTMRLVAGILAMTPTLCGCVYANGFYETFDTRVEPAAMVTPASVPRAEPPLSTTEIRYVRDTARVVFRRRPAERTPDFVAQGPDGYAICLRSGRDYALLVFTRRWRYDGRRFTLISSAPRGEPRRRSGPPPPFQEVCHHLATTPGVESIQAIAFPVGPKP